MRIVIHRVEGARARCDGVEVTRIERGLVMLVGFAATDNARVVRRMAGKAARLRVFETPGSVFGRSLLDLGGQVLTVSQFTLLADTSRGAKPSFSHAAETPVAEQLYGAFADELRGVGVSQVAQAPFATRLRVDIDHWGPFTVVLDSE